MSKRRGLARSGGERRGSGRALPVIWSGEAEEASRGAAGARAGAEPGTVDLGWYWRVIRDHRRAVVRVFLVVLGASVLGTFLQEPTYRAIGMVEIRRAAEEVQPVETLLDAPRISNQYLETQYQLLSSPPVVRRVLAQLDWTDPERAEALGLDAKEVDALRSAVPEGGDALDRVIRMFQDRLIVDPVRGSHLVRVGFDAGDPELSAEIVNAVLRSYVALRVEAAGTGVERIAAQVDSARARLAESEERLHAYVREHELFFLEGPAGETENIVHERLRRLQQQLTEAEAEIHARGAAYDQLRRVGPGTVDSELLQSLSLRIAELRGEHARLSATFTEQYPGMREIASQLRELETSFRAERDRLASNVNNDFQAAVRRHELLLQTFEEQKALVDGLTEKMTEYRILKRDVESQQELYTLLKQRHEEAEVSAALAATEFGIVDPALPPEEPIRPAPKRNIPLGAIAGLFLALGFAFVREVTDPRVKRLEEMDALSLLPVLAMIPSVRSLGNEERRTSLRDAFGTLRTSVLYYASDQAPPSMLVTSARPAEGKTTVSVNLAISLARLGKRVLLIDADVRRPAVHRVLGLLSRPGLVEYLSGAGPWRTFLQPGAVAGLDVLPAGGVAESPSELLSSSCMAELVREAEAEYDHVVLDSPAIFINAADSRILSLLASGVLLVLRSGSTPRDVVRRVLRETPNLIGLVLNDYPARDLPGYYGYYGRHEEDEEEERLALAGRPMDREVSSQASSRRGSP